jgi:hypothetical protein
LHWKLQLNLSFQFSTSTKNHDAVSCWDLFVFVVAR